MIPFYDQSWTGGTDLKERYRAGKVGDVEVKRKLAAINRFLEPMRERRAKYTAQPKFVSEMLAAGREHPQKLGRETLETSHEAMGMNYRL